MSDPLLEARGLCKSYGGASGRIAVLRELDLQVGHGESVAVVGHSGVGKSTLLHVLGGLDFPDRGELRFAGVPLVGVPPRRLAEYRKRRVGFVFQFHYLLPELSALENVELPLRIARSRDDVAGRARRMLVRLGLDSRLGHRPSELSGGEQQRVAIARALVTQPALVLADEPTGNLDPHTGERVFQLLGELQADLGFALVLASHNERLARGCARLLRLDEGRLAALDESATQAYFRGE